MRLSCTKVRVYTPGFGFAVEAYICRNRKNVTCNEHGAQTDQELERLTFHGFPKVLDFLKKEFLASVARKDLERATSTLAVTIFS
jgi:hypothetical protein